MSHFLIGPKRWVIIGLVILGLALYGSLSLRIIFGQGLSYPVGVSGTYLRRFGNCLRSEVVMYSKHAVTGASDDKNYFYNWHGGWYGIEEKRMQVGLFKIHWEKRATVETHTGELPFTIWLYFLNVDVNCT